MYIEKLNLINYRLIKDDKYCFSKNFNVIYGNNAQGKTSIIEAIYFLATAKSFRTKKVIEQINKNSDRLIIFAKTDEDIFSLELTKEKRSQYINREKVKYIDYIAKLLVVSFTPEDIDLITLSPEIRRKHFNYEISQINRKYLENIGLFQKVLKVRNKLIKIGEVNSSLFDIYNKKYISLCYEIKQMRKEYINNLNEVFNKKYIYLFSDEKKVDIKYIPFFDGDLSETEKFINDKLDKDLKYGFTQYGIQKDDFVFYISGEKVKEFASQGERKSIVLALKLAQADDIINRTGRKPIFLLDDINAYLDEKRREKIMQYLKEKNVQCFFTTTEKLDIDAKYFCIKGGISETI